MEYRPDLKNPKPEARAMHALEDAARRIAQECMICQETSLPVVVPANTLTVASSPLLGKTIRITSVKVAVTPYTSSYVGDWDASINSPALTDSGWPTAGSFYIVSAAGTTILGGISAWSVGDLIYSDGSSWKQIRIDQYRAIRELNKPTMDLGSPSPQSGRSTPWGFSQENGIIYLYDPPKCDCAIQITQSITPTSEMSSIEFPEEAEWAILDGAKAYLLELPGDLSNPVLAREYREEFKRGRARLRSIGAFGWGGLPSYESGDFTGRVGGLPGGTLWRYL